MGPSTRGAANVQQLNYSPMCGFTGCMVGHSQISTIPISMDFSQRPIRQPVLFLHSSFGLSTQLLKCITTDLHVRVSHRDSSEHNHLRKDIILWCWLKEQPFYTCGCPLGEVPLIVASISLSVILCSSILCLIQDPRLSYWTR